MALTHRYLFTTSAANAATNLGTAGGNASWVNLANAASAPVDIDETCATISYNNSLRTTMVPTGAFTIILAAKFVVPTAYHAFWGVVGVTALRDDTGTLVFYESNASPANHHNVELGWGVIALTVTPGSPNQLNYYVPGRLSRLAVQNRTNTANIAGNVNALIFGGSPWANVAYGPFKVAEARGYDEALSETAVLDAMEEMRLRMRSLGLTVL